MNVTHQNRRSRNRLIVLNALRQEARPITSVDLAARLQAAGCDLSERSLRLYLNELDAEGMTQLHGRRGGRTITPRGLTEVRSAHTLDRVGSLSARIDQLTYRMSFDLHARSGEVVVNVSLVSPQRLAAAADKVCQVFAQGYAMGTRIAVLGPGQTLGHLTVPPDKVGFCTVSSITLNGVLLKHGVPTASRFGGLLEVRHHQPTRFVEMIEYGGTSIDPLEIFIRAGMTDYHGAIHDGNGLIGASFREMPGDSRPLVVNLADQLKTIGLSAFMVIGQPGQPVAHTPVSEGRIGAVIIGGLNPVAILEESGFRVDSHTLAGLIEFNALVGFEELPRQLQPFL
jgi:repressor of nif and glnA expression